MIVADRKGEHANEHVQSTTACHLFALRNMIFMPRLNMRQLHCIVRWFQLFVSAKCKVIGGRINLGRVTSTSLRGLHNLGKDFAMLGSPPRLANPS
jgi:hypothetical protein